VLVFVVLKLMMVSGSDEQIVLVQELMGVGLLDPRKVLAGQYWRLVTYMFLHKDEVHLLMNMIGLFWFGRVAENIFGTARFVGIFFLAGIVGGIIHCLFQPAELVVGDSGAVMGIFAAVGAGIFRLREYLPARTRHNELSWLVGLALASFFIDQIMPQVASVVHLGGMLAGLSFGFIVSVPRPPYVRAL
jgi:rhomboid protease GluP